MNNKILRACGIVAEYNPFHNGHAYHVHETKRLMSCDVVVSIMSGNWVQRGESAILDKWTRTQTALESGVDIVVELPSMFAVQAADYFGLGAMKIAKQLQLSQLAFGVENVGTVYEMGNILDSEHTYTQKDFTQSHGQRFSTQSLQLPNQLLANAYIKGLKSIDYAMDLLPIERVGSGHSTQTLSTHAHISSATAIRLAHGQQKDVSGYVPNCIANALQHVSFDSMLFWQLLKYQITQSSLEELRTIYQMSEGIEHVLKREIGISNGYDDFLNRVQNKRFTKKRLQRLCVYIVLRWTNEMVQSFFQKECLPIRVLGFSPKGNRYLKQLDNTTYTTQLKKQMIEDFSTTIHADKVYEQLTGVSEQNFKRVVRVNEVYATL